MKLVHSFDVFDTCLLRACAFPVDVFYETGLLLSARHGLEPSDEWASGFAIARSNAEAVARAESGAEDVVLEQIWKVLHEGRPDLPATEGMEAELRVEERLLRPNPEILARLSRLRARGTRILFISDTYFPRSFVQRMLVRFGFWCDGDGLYVSGELGITKASGSLYRHVLRETGIPAHMLAHCGDNGESDVQVPIKLGIRTKHYRGAWFTPNERRWINDRSDYGQVGRRFVGLMRTSRLQAHINDRDWRDFVYEFLGPFLVTFANWVLAEAKREGVHRLYFLSRDCYLLQQVAAKIACDLGGPECRYLFTSRQALLLPTVRSAGRQELAWLVDDEKNPRIETLLAKINLHLADCGAELRSLAGSEGDDFRLQTQAQWEQFWSGLAEPKVQAKIHATAAEQRRLAMAYFRQEGLINEGKVGLVDLGWRLNIQRACNLILNSETGTRSVEGFYLGISPDRKWDHVTGRATALFDIGPRIGYAKSDRDDLFSYANILEYIVSFSPHGTVHHYEQYDGTIKPRCLPSDGGTADNCSIVAALLNEYVNEYRSSFQAATCNPENAKHIIDHLIEKTTQTPKSTWGRLFETFTVSSNQNNLDSVPLVKPLSFTDALGFLLKGRKYLDKHHHARWLEASITMSGKISRGLYHVRNLTRKTIRARRGLF